MPDFKDFPRNRPETGPMQFGDDWRGYFFRGDNAMGHIVDLKVSLEIDKGMSDHTRKAIEDIVAELSRSNHHTPDRVQHMQPFTDAFVEDRGEIPDSA